MADPAHQDSLNGKLGGVYRSLVRVGTGEPKRGTLPGWSPLLPPTFESQIYDEKEDRRIIYFLILHLENFCYRPLYWPLTSVKLLIRTNMCLLLVSTSTRRYLLMIHR